MIQLSERFIELINQSTIDSFVLIKVDDLLLTDYPSNLTLPDGVYISTDLIAEVDEPQLTSVVDRDLYKMKFVDSERIFLPIFETGLNGADVSVRLGIVDNDTGEPDLQNLFVVYDGIVESYNYAVDTAPEGAILATITGSNLMASLDESEPYYTSKSFVKQISPTDTSYDQIYEGSESVTLLWGRKE